MRKNRRILLVAALFVLLPAAIIRMIYLRQPASDKELFNLMDRLQTQGYSIQYEASNKDILQGERYVIYYGDRQFMNVFLYRTEKEAKKDSKRLDQDGSTYSKGGLFGYTMQIDYAVPIHYFRKNNMIVSWGGERDEMYQFLVQELGEQFAGR